MRAIWRAIAREPRPAGAPPMGRADWLLVAAFEAAALIEGIARPELPGRLYVILLAMAVIPALLWRRSHPLPAVLVGFGAAGLLAAVQLATGTTDLGPSSMMVVLILLYSLVRWGAGREIVQGLIWVIAMVVLGMYAATAGLPDLIGGSLLLLLIVSLAAVFRARADLAQRQRLEIRNQERLALARELHDTVAHHVSAIAVQAQAGGVVVHAQPAQAAQVLATIEVEATRTLAEMRAMVRVLREDGWDTYAPQPGVGDLAALARSVAQLHVEVSVTGDVSGLPGPVDSAVYRIAQESLTNAVRHAPGATRVDIELYRVGDDLRLRVIDDGRSQTGSAPPPGFGVTGMTERAQLLGGSLSAGPGPVGGWIVEAVLPVQVS